MFSYDVNFLIYIIPEIFLFLSIILLFISSIIIIMINKLSFENKNLISSIRLLSFFILFIYIYLLFNSGCNIARTLNYDFLIQYDINKVIKILLSFLTLWIINQKIYFENVKSFFFEISIFFLTCLLSFSFLISSDNLIDIYIFIELQSLIFIILSALAKKLSSFESSIQYFIISLISSCFLLLSISLLYGMFGTIDLKYIFMLVDILNINIKYNFNWNFYNILSLLVLSILIKMGSFPFFYWLPKVYNNSLMFISSYFSTISFIAYFIFLFNFFMNCLYISINSIDIFFISCLGSIFFGSIGLLYQVKIKRFMSYNSILNIGYILSIMICIFSEDILNINMTINTITILYLISYSIMNVNLWSILLSTSLGNKNESPFVFIQEFSIMRNYNKLLWVLFIFSLCTMAGLPPFLGFSIKFFLICTVLKAGHFYYCFFLIFLTLFSIVSYLIIIKIITFDNIINFDKTSYTVEFFSRLHIFIISITSMFILSYFPFLDIIVYLTKF